MDPQTEITELRARVLQLEREKHDVESFAAMAAHELLTPVVMMDACAATVSERLAGDHNDESLRDLDRLRCGAARSRLLAETLLHHASCSDRPLRRGAVDLGLLVDECLEVLAAEARLRAATIEVGALPVLDVEEPLIGAVFMNLLANALKYGPRHGATIRVGARPEPGAWRFAVESEGDPILAADRERIFERFRRGSGERRVRGSGLGLYICRNVVERHGGAIRVVPGARGGNRFEFTLPQ